MPGELLVVYLAGIVLVLVAGLYYLLVTTNLIRAVIGLELLTKAVTLAIVLGGHLTNKPGLGQALAVTVIVVEVVVMAAAAGILLCAHRQNKSMDARLLRNVKG
jgi:multisubunit Na+/H+ antiporter MnhC subunit